MLTSQFQSCQIRYLTNLDIEEALVIEAMSFAHPWGEATFRETLKHRDCYALAAEIGQQLVGFMVYDLFPKHYQLLTLAVHPMFRRMGVGRSLMNKLVAKMCQGQRCRIMTAVHESQLGAHLFLKASGFRATAILKNYYPDCSDEAYLFQLRKPCLSVS